MSHGSGARGQAADGVEVPDDLDRALRAAGSVAEACRATVDNLVRAGYPMPSVYLEQSGRLRCQASHGYWQIYDGMPPAAGVIGRTFRTGEPQIVRSPTEEEAYLPAVTEVREEVCVPIRVAGRCAGALNVETVDRLSSDTPEVLATTAQLLGQRIETLGGLPAESPMRRLATHALTFVQEPVGADALEQALVAATELSGLSSGMIAVIAGASGVDGREHSTMRTRADDLDWEVTTRTRPATWQAAGASGPLGDQLAALSEEDLALVASWVESGTSCYTVARSTGLGFYGAAILQQVGVRSLIVIPLDAAAGRLGILLMADSAEHSPSTETVERLELFGAIVASSLRTAEVMRQLESRADRDPLTELRHGGSFRVDLARALSDRRFASRTAVLAIDVDNFKEVNDTRGHPMGDDVLRRLAMTLAGALRDADRVYRVGGDEFAALLRVRDGSDALATAQRLRSAVRQAGDLPTLSIGVAVQEPREDPQDLVQRADAALYAVKRGGRDGTRLHAS